MGRKNLKVPESLFLALQEDKPDSMTWPAYLERECLGDSRETDGIQDTRTATVGLTDDALADIEDATDADLDAETIAEMLAERIDYPESQDVARIEGRIDDLETELRTMLEGLQR